MNVCIINVTKDYLHYSESWAVTNITAYLPNWWSLKGPDALTCFTWRWL